ncbi:hypothetical protein ACF09H_02715 [Streptomyces sp. NPDC014983]|uniref:hypothetical protein n=1 Tax=Streptomyces sp. NPDC014983 TaxID=3364933 RepID=UPI0036FE400B
MASTSYPRDARGALNTNQLLAVAAGFVIVEPGARSRTLTNSDGDLTSQFAEYQASLKLHGGSGYGPLTARNYDDYLLKQYIQPSATTYISATECAKPSA